MKHNVEAFKKYYINATKEEVIEDMFLDNCNLQQEIERLNNIIKEKEEGFKASTEDLCETTEELEKANNIINKMNDYLVMNIANGSLDFMYRQGFKDSYEKLQELKGSNK